MKQIYIFCHGFGFNNKFWENLKPYFKNKECFYLDTGYFGPHYNSFPFNQEYEYIGIGHSLGLIKLIQLNISFKALIGLNSFINFLGNNKTLRKKRSIELAFLQESFLKNEISALNAFYKRCGLINWNLSNTQFINKNKLLESLKTLQLNFKLPANTKVCIITANNDIIVPKILIEDNFNNQSLTKRINLQKGSHTLGYNYAREIYLLINDFLNAQS